MAGSKKPRRGRPPKNRKKQFDAAERQQIVKERAGLGAGTIADSLAKQLKAASKEDNASWGEILYRVAVNARDESGMNGARTYQMALAKVPEEKRTALLRVADEIADADFQSQGGPVEDRIRIMPSELFNSDLPDTANDLTADLAREFTDISPADTRSVSEADGSSGAVTSRRDGAQTDYTTAATPDPDEALAKLRRASGVYNQYLTKLEAALEAGVTMEQFDATPAAQRLQRQLFDSVDGDIDILDYLDMSLAEQEAPPDRFTARDARSSYGTGLGPEAYGFPAFDDRPNIKDERMQLLGPYFQRAERFQTLIPLLNRELAPYNVNLELTGGRHLDPLARQRAGLVGASNQAIKGTKTSEGLLGELRRVRNTPVDENVSLFDNVIQQGIPLSQYVFDRLPPEYQKQIMDRIMAGEPIDDLFPMTVNKGDFASGGRGVNSLEELMILGALPSSGLLDNLTVPLENFAEGGPSALPSQDMKDQLVASVQSRLQDARRRNRTAKQTREIFGTNSELQDQAISREGMISPLLRGMIDLSGQKNLDLAPSSPVQQINLQQMLRRLISPIAQQRTPGSPPLTLPIALPENMATTRQLTRPGRPASVMPVGQEPFRDSSNTRYRKGTPMGDDLIRRDEPIINKMLRDLNRLAFAKADELSGQAIDPNFTRKNNFNLSMRVPDSFRRQGVFFDPFNHNQPYGGLAFPGTTMNDTGLLPPHILATLIANNLKLDPMMNPEVRTAIIDYLTRQAAEQLPMGPSTPRARQEFGISPLPSKEGEPARYRQPHMIGGRSLQAIKNEIIKRSPEDGAAMKEFMEGVRQFNADLEAGRYDPASPNYRAIQQEVDPYGPETPVEQQQLPIMVDPPAVDTDSVDPYAMSIRRASRFARPTYQIPTLRNLLLS